MNYIHSCCIVQGPEDWHALCGTWALHSRHGAQPGHRSAWSAGTRTEPYRKSPTERDWLKLDDTANHWQTLTRRYQELKQDLGEDSRNAVSFFFGNRKHTGSAEPIKEELCGDWQNPHAAPYRSIVCSQIIPKCHAAMRVWAKSCRFDRYWSSFKNPCPAQNRIQSETSLDSYTYNIIILHIYIYDRETFRYHFVPVNSDNF